MDTKQKVAATLEEAIKVEAGLFWDRLEELKTDNPSAYTEIMNMIEDLRIELNTTNKD